MPTIKVKMSALKADQKYQPREELNGDEVQNYAELLSEGHKFPAPTVIDNKNGTYSLISGFHRFAAHKLNQSIDIDVEVLDLAPLDALIEAIQSNAKHGLKYTNEDKHRCIKLILKCVEAKSWSDNKVAKICGVSNHLVKKIREDSGLAAKTDSVTIQRGDQVYEQKTKNIGPKKISRDQRLKEIQRLLELKTQGWSNTLTSIRLTWEDPEVEMPTQVVRDLEEFIEWWHTSRKGVA